MILEELGSKNLLSMQQEKGKICVSIIIPTHRLSPERRVDQLTTEKTIKNAKKLLQKNYKTDEINLLMEAMDEWYNTIDFTHNSDGLGFYVSANIKLAVRFPFPVEEKLVIGDNFEMRDLLYKANYSYPYYVLLIAEKGVKLFEGIWDELHEVKDKNFPKTYTEEYLYNPPSRSTSYAGDAHVKSFEKDKSELEAIRFKTFFRSSDAALNHYFSDAMPLLLLGVEKELDWFEEVSDHKKQIIAKIPGNYHYANEKQLADIVWPPMRLYLEVEREELIKEFEEKVGEELGVTGIQDIWSAVQEGKGFKLLVEKDYKCQGFLAENDYQLYLQPPINLHKVLPDAVDDLIEMVLKKNGQVFFVANGRLKEYQGIALIARY